MSDHPKLPDPPPPTTIRHIFYDWCKETYLEPTESRFEAFEAGCARIFRAPAPAEDGEELREALMHVRGIIMDAAEVGFNWQKGDWADRLFASQAITKAALSSGRDGRKT